ncbi:MAG: hypothetical protein IPK55_11815 [Streptococcus sp.]|nr:hypothetical protein [Streptococcus sp.]
MANVNYFLNELKDFLKELCVSALKGFDESPFDHKVKNCEEVSLLILVSEDLPKVSDAFDVSIEIFGHELFRS